jgi:excisionase family DNA binding protein
MTGGFPKPDPALVAWGRTISEAFRKMGGETVERTTETRPFAEAADFPAISKGNKATVTRVAKHSALGEKLLTTSQIADELSVTTEQVRRLVQDGELHGINVGRRGAKRQSMRFSSQDVADFKARRRTETSCLPSIKTKSRNSTRRTSGSKVVSFLDQQKERAAAKLKQKPTGSK